MEYYQLWRSTGGHSSPESLYETLYPMPPPLPPRAAHRPLHRSNALPTGAPELPKRHPQRHPTPLHPEDCFGFEIVDVDEASNLKVKKLSSEINNSIYTFVYLEIKLYILFINY